MLLPYHFRLMLLPFALVVDVSTTTESWDGWCCCHVAGVIATAGWCELADVIASGRWKSHRVILFYFNLSSEVLTRTSSQTCGRWYLPTFLLRDGSLTLMYRASFIVLIWFKSSLPIILKLLMVTLVTTDVTMVIYGRGGFQVFLEPFSKSSRGLSNIFLITVHSCHNDNCQMTPLCFRIGSLSFGDIRRFLMVVPPLQCTCTPNFLPMFLIALTEPSIVRYHNTGSLGDVAISVVCLFSGWVVCLLLYFVYSPCGVLAVLQCILRMFFFFV